MIKRKIWVVFGYEFSSNVRFNISLRNIQQPYVNKTDHGNSRVFRALSSVLKPAELLLLFFFGSWEPPDGIAVKLVGLVAIKEGADISRLHK